MPRLEVIGIVKPICPDWLEAYKQYASVPDDGRDALLMSLLKSAILRVQEHADRAIVATDLRLTADCGASGIVRLYEGGGSIVSVTDERGEAVPFDPLPGNRVQLYVRNVPVKIVYRTEPLDGDVDDLKPSVFRYATALYDGEEQKVLDSILAETR